MAQRIMSRQEFEKFAKYKALEHKRRQATIAQDNHARQLIDTMETVGSQNPSYGSGVPESLGEFIKRRIAEHQRMIKTLEWFGSHLGLDKPDGDLLVDRIIYEGLEALMIKKRDGRL